MPVIALEEHYATPDVLEAWRTSDTDDPSMPRATRGDVADALADLGEGRIATMDRTGVDRQVLSLSTPGVQDLPPREAVALATAANDEVVATIRARPDRFGGFATLPLGAPDDAAAELQRAVGLGLDGAMVFPRSQGRPLDDTTFWPVLEAAEALRAPLYLHPQAPPVAVQEAYYSGFDAAISGGLATFGIGWHYDAGLQFIRLALSGALDRFPELQIVLGHWGEVVLFYLERLDGLAAMAATPRTFSQYVADQVHVTPGGVLSPRYLRWATDVVGVERILFAVDHPFRVPTDDGVAQFLSALDDADRDAVTSGNWERLRARIVR